MKASLADQLKDISLNFRAYGNLPIREDVLLFKFKEGEKPILKQWEKLNLIRKNLIVLNQYLKTSKGETIAEWLAKTNEHLSDHVIDKIGNHNDSTGGISEYFFNLQNFYDQEEKIYDEAESKILAPGEAAKAINEMRKTRSEKRNARAKIRKEKLKGLKADGKGYLLIKTDEPTLISADGKTTEPEKKPEPAPDKKETEKAVDEVKKARKRIGIYLAGTVIFITIITLAFKSKD